MTDKIVKAGSASAREADDAALEKINRFSLKPLTAEEVFTFRVAMCDNQIDRDFEAFSTKTLSELAEKFTGRTVISDHLWQSDRQVARIYSCSDLAAEPNAGRDIVQLVAECYMLANEENKSLIASINAGITKEVSVGCSIKSAICSICGTDNLKSSCEHSRGKVYDGNLCYFTLDGARDAYELSFVAVPAQRGASIIKSPATKLDEIAPRSPNDIRASFDMPPKPGGEERCKLTSLMLETLYFLQRQN